MQLHDDAPRHLNTEAPRLGQTIPYLLRPLSLIGFLILALTTLACAFLESAVPIAPTAIVTRTPLPTFTLTAPGTSLAMAMPGQPTVASPTPAPSPTSPPGTEAAVPASPAPAPTPISAPTVASTAGETPGQTPAAIPAPIPTDTPAASPTPPIPTATPAIAPMATPISEASGWSFSGVRVHTDQDENNLRVYGNFINATGTSQELLFITGTFYDAQGQVIADEESTYDYWSVPVIPPGGRMPFELTVEGIQSAANFDLRVEAEPSNENPRQDFEFSDLYEDAAEGLYCVGGTLRNPGDRLQDYLLIVAILYDSQDRVINFNDRYADPEYAAGDDPQDFEVCVDTLSQEVTRYELQAWGQ
jgi:hypothetical protein